MSIEIDRLLNQKEYDIYNYIVKQESLFELANLMSHETANILEYFSLKKCSTKFCWMNYIYIIENLDEKKRIEGIPVLFEMLQDMNWPVYQKAIQILTTFEKKDIIFYLEKYLQLAYEEQDFMWISGIKILAEQMEITRVDFQNEDNYNIFKYGDY